MGDWASGLVLPDIPRIYTAIAEWLACMICIVEMKRRISGWKFIVFSLAVLILQILFLVATDDIDGVMWIVCMMMAIGIMFLFLWISCEGTALNAGYYCVEAFVLAELAASLEWQLHCFFCYGMNMNSYWLGAGILIIVYGGIFGLVGNISRHYLLGKDEIEVTARELLMAVTIGTAVFLISNIGFVYSNTPFSGKYSSDIFNIRTLIDLGGVAILYAYHIQRLNLHMKRELEIMEATLQNQYIQYEQSKETLDLINYKYHDLKHHILVLRAEESKDKRNEYLDHMEEEIRNYETQNKTGNHVLDTLLTSKSMYCMKENISLTSVADGALLHFMDVMDICSIFGNALDNAIECEKRISEIEKRMIHMSVYAKKSFLMIIFENYCEEQIEFAQNLPKTTKGDGGFHGYGLKSLQHTVHKYGGAVDISVEDNWFKLKILIPMQTMQKRGLS